MAPKYSPRTGEVFVRNFDEGVHVRLGAYTGEFEHLGFGPRFGYWVDLSTNTPMRVPVQFNQPEPIYERRLLPSFLITRDPPEPDLARWHSVRQLEYVAGVSGTETTAVINGQTVSGYEQIEEKAQAWPYSIIYTITCFARYEHEAIPMLRRILRQFQPNARIPVIDSLGHTRWYSVFHEGGFQELSELADVADRMKAYAQAIRVEAELDVNDPVIRGTLGTFALNLGVL